MSIDQEKLEDELRWIKNRLDKLEEVEHPTPEPAVAISEYVCNDCRVMQLGRAAVCQHCGSLNVMRYVTEQPSPAQTPEPAGATTHRCDTPECHVEHAGPKPSPARGTERPPIEEYKKDNWYISSGRAKAICLLCDYALSLERTLAETREANRYHHEMAGRYGKEAAELREQVSRLEQDVEVGLQISGSFFEALKPLHLTSVNVTNPGRHVTELVRERDEARNELNEFKELYRQLKNVEAVPPADAPYATLEGFTEGKPHFVMHDAPARGEGWGSARDRIGEKADPHVTGEGTHPVWGVGKADAKGEA